MKNNDFEVLSKLEILLVEDNDMVIDSLSYVFQKYFKDLHIAKCGLEGFKKYKATSPDVIVADIDMPKHDGISMIKKIRSIDKKTPIVVNSAINDETIISKVKEIGIHEYIPKPTDIKELLLSIQNSLKNLQ